MTRGRGSSREVLTCSQQEATIAESNGRGLRRLGMAPRRPGTRVTIIYILVVIMLKHGVESCAYKYKAVPVLNVKGFGVPSSLISGGDSPVRPIPTPRKFAAQERNNT